MLTENEKKTAMIEWLAKQLDEQSEFSPQNAPCHKGEQYHCPSESPISCAKCWINEAEKEVQDAVKK